MITVDSLKKHLQIPGTFAGDDEYLSQIAAPSQLVASGIGSCRYFLDLDDSEESTAILEKPQVSQAMLMLGATLYNNRESEVYSGTQETKAFDRLMYQFKKW